MAVDVDQNGNTKVLKRSDTAVSPLSKTRYTVKHLKYPENVGGSDTQHYVCFYINVRKQTKYHDQKFIGIRSNESAGISEQELDENLTAVGASVAAGGVGVWLGAKFIGKRLKGAGAVAKAIEHSGSSFGKSMVLAGTAVAAIGGLFKADQKMRLNEVITLAVQASPTTRYSVQYDDTSLGSITGMLGANNTTGDVIDYSGDILKLAAMSAAKLPGQIAQSFDLASGAQFMSKTVPNPFKELLFKTVERRSFSFEYRFMPKNAAESENVRKIIERFRFHMHPELNSTKLFYIYPSEFEIIYYYKNEENLWFSKISTCALADMSVDYGGEQFATFESGAPIEVVLKLQFQETEVLTKDRLDDATEGF